MSIFGDVRPDGITEEELPFIRSELLNGDHPLTRHQVDLIEDELRGYLDADNPRHPEWKQMQANEVAEFEQHQAGDRSLSLTPAQKIKLNTVLEKYLRIIKHKSMF